MSQTVSLIRSAELSVVAQYAYAATAPAEARLIFFAGDCPLNLDDVLSTRVLVASSKQSDLVDAWTVIRETFGEHDAPSTLMGVPVLGYTDQLVEIESIAAVID